MRALLLSLLIVFAIDVIGKMLLLGAAAGGRGLPRRTVPGLLFDGVLHIALAWWITYVLARL